MSSSKNWRFQTILRWDLHVERMKDGSLQKEKPRGNKGSEGKNEGKHGMGTGSDLVRVRDFEEISFVCGKIPEIFLQ